MVSSGKASLHELGTSLGVEDLYMLLEVINVDAHNARVVAARRRQENG